MVDEFHTFDGAQGTDLACLIRRLRDRLQCAGEQLVCVGTSATLGGPDSRQAMLDYAGQIFASHFEPGSLIEEERLSPEEFFRDHTGYGDPDNGGLFPLPLPGMEAQEQLDPEHASSAPSARKDDASPFRPFQPPGGLMEPTNASLQRGRQG